MTNALSALAAQGAGGAALATTIDSMVAQHPIAGTLQDFAQSILTSIGTAYPEAIVTRSASGRNVNTGRGGGLNGGLNFGTHAVDWSKVDTAERIIIELQMQNLLSSLTNSTTSNLIQMALSMGLMVASLMATALAQPEIVAALTSTALAIDIGVKILSVIASTMPGQITDFYVVVNGVQRRTNDPAVNITIDYNTPLKVELVTSSNGGLSFSALGTAAVISGLVEKFVPGLGAALEGNPAIFKALGDQMLSIGDTIWQLSTNGPPPAIWRTTSTFNFPPFKYPAQNINSSRVLTITTTSTKLISIGTDSSRAYYIRGIHSGSNAGYRCFVSTQALVAGLPSLADILNTRWLVKGFVNVTAGTVQLNLS